jgi:hypothetical protein
MGYLCCCLAVACRSQLPRTHLLGGWVNAHLHTETTDALRELHPPLATPAQKRAERPQCSASPMRVSTISRSRRFQATGVPTSLRKRPSTNTSLTSRLEKSTSSKVSGLRASVRGGFAGRMVFYPHGWSDRIGGNDRDDLPSYEPWRSSLLELLCTDVWKSPPWRRPWSISGRDCDD